jgi:hypothetical protein
MMASTTCRRRSILVWTRVRSTNRPIHLLAIVAFLLVAAVYRFVWFSFVSG